MFELLFQIFDTADFGSKDRSGHARKPTPEPATVSGRPPAMHETAPPGWWAGPFA